MMNEEISHFVQILDECKEILIRLQSIDPKTVLKLLQARSRFNLLIRKHPLLEHNLKANSVHVIVPILKTESLRFKMAKNRNFCARRQMQLRLFWLKKIYQNQKLPSYHSWIQFFLKPRNKQKRNPRVPNIEQLSTCLQPLVSANKLILKQNTS